MDILIVDGNSGDSRYEQRILASYLLNPVRIARDSTEALRCIFGGDGKRLRLPQIVFADISAPQVAAPDLVHALRADPRTAHVPIVLMSSSPSDTDPTAALGHNRCAHVVKPLDLGQLAEALRKIGVKWVLMDPPPAVATPTYSGRADYALPLAVG